MDSSFMKYPVVREGKETINLGGNATTPSCTVLPSFPYYYVYSLIRFLLVYPMYESWANLDNNCSNFHSLHCSMFLWLQWNTKHFEGEKGRLPCVVPTRYRTRNKWSLDFRLIVLFWEESRPHSQESPQCSSVCHSLAFPSCFLLERMHRYISTSI